MTSALATIGVQALAITLATIGGSILMIFLVRKALRLNRYGGLEKDAQEQEHRGKAGTSDLKSTVGIVSLVIAGIAVGRFGLVDQFPDHLEEDFDHYRQWLDDILMRADRYYRIRSRSFGNGGCKFKVGRSQSAGISAGDPGRAPCWQGAGRPWHSAFLSRKASPSVLDSAGIPMLRLSSAAAGPQYAVAGAVAFLHNVMRETAGIIFIPLGCLRKLGYLEAISIPGIGTMDVCMPIVEQSCRQDTVVYGFVSGFLLCIFTSFSVPVLMG